MMRLGALISPSWIGWNSFDMSSALVRNLNTSALRNGGYGHVAAPLDDFESGERGERNALRAPAPRRDNPKRAACLLHSFQA